MNSALLLTTVVVLSTGRMFAQQANLPPADSGLQQQISESRVADSTQKIVATNSSQALNASIDPMMVTSDNRLVDDAVCYTIRSYVVARDSKHSDAVHHVGYSTCQPASKYRLRTTQMISGSADKLSR